MNSIVAVMLVLGLADVSWQLAEAEQSADIGVDELKAHVFRLSSPEFLGRRGPGAARTAYHLALAFDRLGLAPAFGDSYFQSIPWLVGNPDPKKPGFIGRNVGAVLPGADPVLKDEWIVLSAHFDHLGRRGEQLYPGADDNASGVAMLLEVAEQFALAKKKPRRTVLFVGFDLEESGLQGSSHFATRPPRDFKKLKACVNADMIGRSMVNVMDEYVFVLGSESAPRLRRLLEEESPEDGLRVGRMGADLIGNRSDYGPFRDRRIPFLFFSTGQHPDYHRPGDLPEKIDYVKLGKISRWIGKLTRRLADDEESPAWAGDAKPDVEEARTALVMVERVLRHPESFPLKDAQKQLVSGVVDKLRSIVRRGEVTPEERTWLLWTSRLLLATVF